MLLLILMALPVAGILPCLVLRSPRHILGAIAAVVTAVAAAAGACVAAVFGAGPVRLGRMFFLDALSAYNLSVMALVFLLSSWYALSYFRDDIRAGAFTRRDAVRYAALWLGSLASMILVLISDNLGIMWVGVEATTLLTALLIYVHRSPASLEAMWKYILICSVGVAFAFMGTLLVAASGRNAPDALLWTGLVKAAPSLDADTLKIGFIFLLVGYGTKAGLAPMHSWLPDAHSQAPAPVSAIFSGFMLNAALYCVMRYVPLVEAATGRTGWSLKLLILFGLVSILVAASFIVFQHDVKRLLAYHSVEHLGIIALGLGLGGLGTFGALFHTLNHSVCKTLGFFCAGRLGQLHGTHDMTRMTGTLRSAPLWGSGFLGAILALIGVAPFAIFMSEFQILKAAADSRSFWTLLLFLAGSSVVFVAALRHAIAMAWGEPSGSVRSQEAGVAEKLLVFAPLGLLLLAGLWMPPALQRAIEQAAGIIGGRP